MTKTATLVEQVKKYLEPDEEIVCHASGGIESAITGSASSRTGILLATDRRLVFYRKKISGYDYEYFPYENLTPFGHSKELTGKGYKFIGSGIPFLLQGFGDDEEFAEVIRIVTERIAAGK